MHVSCLVPKDGEELPNNVLVNVSICPPLRAEVMPAEAARQRRRSEWGSCMGHHARDGRAWNLEAAIGENSQQLITIRNLMVDWRSADMQSGAERGKASG